MQHSNEMLPISNLVMLSELTSSVLLEKTKGTKLVSYCDRQRHFDLYLLLCLKCWILETPHVLRRLSTCKL